MEHQFIVPIQKNSTILNFEVRDYPHKEEYNCKFELFLENNFVASFEPDHHGYLHICQNPGQIEKETLYKISGEIEKYNW
jgi:hypothetical protein